MLTLEYLGRLWDDLTDRIADGEDPNAIAYGLVESAGEAIKQMTLELASIVSACAELVPTDDPKGIIGHATDAGHTVEQSRYEEALMNVIGASAALVWAGDSLQDELRAQMLVQRPEDMDITQAQAVAGLAESMAYLAGFAIPSDVEEFWREFNPDED